MDIQKLNKPHLEPILEESEQEDEIRGSETEESEEDEVQLRVMRPRRLPRSLSKENFPQMQYTNTHQEESFSVSDRNSHAEHLSDEATPPVQARLGNEKRSRSGELKIKVSKIEWKKHPPPKPPAQKKRTSRRREAAYLFEEPFPEWLVDLMVNIEEATTHQLVVE